jgi:hypothetical protein
MPSEAPKTPSSAMARTRPVRARALPLLALAAAVLLPAEALAISRIETMRATCGEVKSRIDREGAVILRYPSRRSPGHVLYDRYVADRHSCVMGEVTERAFVPTRDTPSCPVLKCFRPDYDDFFNLRPRPFR